MKTKTMVDTKTVRVNYVPFRSWFSFRYDDCASMNVFWFGKMMVVWYK